MVNNCKDKAQYQIQGKEFQPLEFTDLRPPSYEEDSTSDEYFTAEPKVIWMIKKRKKWFEVEEEDNVFIIDLIINGKEYVLERQPENVED